jgi:hypothetical protein
MRITRSRLKQIIMEEVNLVEATPELVDLEADSGNAPANQGGMDEITEEITSLMESEAMGLINDIAQVLADSGVLGTSDPEEMAQALMGLGKMGTYMLGAGAMGGAAMAGKEAIAKLFGVEDKTVSPDEEPEMGLEEEEGNTLEQMITNLIREELG